jgi:hypothetical protein
MVFILFLAFLLSTNRRVIRPRTVLPVAMAGEAGASTPVVHQYKQIP